MRLTWLFLESGGFEKGAGCFALRRGAGTLSLYPARASAALDPVRGTRPLTLFGPSLFEEAVDDLLFGFRFGQAQGHQLDDLLTRDLTNRRLVD